MRPGARQKWTWRFTDSDRHCLSWARLLQITISTSNPTAVTKFISRSGENPLSLYCRSANRLGSVTRSASAAAACESPGFQYLIQQVGEAKPGPTPAGVRRSEVGEHAISSACEGSRS